MASPHWPLFDLHITTPRLELRYPTDDDLFALAGIPAEGIHDPETMPFAKPFTTTHTVTTGSWLVQRAHGQGIGKEMRAAVLHLAFQGLGAVEAYTDAFDDNPASLGVTRALGYEPNGTRLYAREGASV